MTRFWTCHWQFRYWRPDVNNEGEPVCSSGSNNFHKRDVSVGDFVYIVSLSEGYLYLGGRMIVEEIISRQEAVRRWKDDNLYDAEEWIVGPEESGTLLNLKRRLAPALTKQLRFESKKGLKAPYFVSDTTKLDNQTTRGVRELTRESATILDRIIAVTDQLPRSGEVVDVTEELLRIDQSVDRVDVSISRIVRDTELTKRIKQLHNFECQLCGYAIILPDGSRYAEGHHIQPLGTPHNGPDRDDNVLCLCPNHHAACDLGAIPLTESELRRVDGHTIGQRFIDYHNRTVYRGNSPASPQTGFTSESVPFAECRPFVSRHFVFRLKAWQNIATPTEQTAAPAPFRL